MCKEDENESDPCVSLAIQAAKKKLTILELKSFTDQ